MNAKDGSGMDWGMLARSIKLWGREAGFDAIGIAGVEMERAEAGLLAWLQEGFHGEMDYMARHGLRRARPAELVPGTLSVVCARLNYWPTATAAACVLQDGERAYISRYALGRDYHKVLRKRLAALAGRMREAVGALGGHMGYRVFTDSAPVMEVELARQAGLGWRGKHTLLLD